MLFVWSNTSATIRNNWSPWHILLTYYFIDNMVFFLLQEYRARLRKGWWEESQPSDAEWGGRRQDQSVHRPAISSLNIRLEILQIRLKTHRSEVNPVRKSSQHAKTWRFSYHGHDSEKWQTLLCSSKESIFKWLPKLSKPYLIYKYFNDNGLCCSEKSN